MHLPAMLAVALALLPLLAAALDATCAPASCGNLSVRYPFWLRGHQPSYCGYPSFAIACDDATGAPPVLNGSNLRVLDIHYGNSSVVAFHAGLADDPTGCRATWFNVSTTLALSSLLAVSRANWELLFSSNCSRMPPPAGSVPMNCTSTGHGLRPWLVYLSRQSYGTGGPVRDTTSSTGCRYSAVPVLPESPELRALDDYARLVRRGFLMEWMVPGDCAACNASGGQCRHDDGGVDAFRCLCPDGSLQPAACVPGEFTDPGEIRYKASQLFLTLRN